MKEKIDVKILVGRLSYEVESSAYECLCFTFITYTFGGIQ